ncbi:hypothetical protein [Planctomicrobium sp. SH664]|uniref:hypothetical protein n=1 Tax=Planctomicrobium sp. SH664 TaxID=3448125 RepID=UPI003F5BB2AF
MLADKSRDWDAQLAHWGSIHESYGGQLGPGPANNVPGPDWDKLAGPNGGRPTYSEYLNPWKAGRADSAVDWKDNALRWVQQGAIVTGIIAGVGAVALEFGATLGITQIGTVGLAELPTQAAIEYHLITGGAVTFTGTVASHLDRPCQNSRAFVDMIARGFPGKADPGNAANALRWDAAGSFQGRKGIFELAMNSSGQIHFLFKGRKK